MDSPKQETIEQQRNATVVVNARADVRTLAELCLFFTGQGERIRTKSWLIRLITEGLRDVLKSNNLLPKTIPNVEDAVQELENLGLGNFLERGRRGAVSLREVVVAENLMQDNAGIESGDIDREVTQAAEELMRKMGIDPGNIPTE